ncbi:uncharacterized protein LOC113331625 [Papaver somniferum]|uniref:uncharacterized protein LOC113331625 n=1 Tax=Papaver somniferum TaxID=3469 RepID=UPI000E6FA953|nr:uncharacterized protein LOC113331625 [Papaver somniferum]
MQPKICKECWVVVHVEENCKRLAQEHKVEAMDETRFAEYSQTEEGKAFLAGYILEKGVDSNMEMALNQNAIGKDFSSESETSGKGEIRKSKRVTEDGIQNLSNPNSSAYQSSHNNPIYQLDDINIEETGMDGSRNDMDSEMDYHNYGGKEAMDNSSNQADRMITQNQHGGSANSLGPVLEQPSFKL